MTDKEALKLAKECGATTHTNRRTPEATSVMFDPLAWETFCEQALAAPVQPVAWLYPAGLEALKAGKCWTAYGTKQDDNCNISVYLNAAVAPKVEPVKTECDGFDSHPAAPVQEPMETYIHHCRYQPHPNDFGIPKGHWWQAKQYADAVNTTPPAQPAQQELYNELLFSVARVHPHETRHQTALRYIQQAESGSSDQCEAAHGIKE
jgi:hypothetical protein